MVVSFQPDICLPRDPSGFGMWLNGHYREHLQMAQICLTLATPIVVPQYDILSWRDEPELVQQWLLSHEQIHEVLRQACNVSGADLSLVDFSEDDQFLEWMDDHAQEHINFRTVLGIK